MAGKTGARQRRERSLFRTVIVPLLCLVAAEILILVNGLYHGDVMDRLNENARKIVDEQTENRGSYMENSMVQNWSDLSWLSRRVQQITQDMLDRGELSLEDLDSSSQACTPLLINVYQDLISSLYSKQVSGVFIIFNTSELDRDSNSWETRKTGIYIRDLDPQSKPSGENADLLLERAPIAVVQTLEISTDSGWNPMFYFSQRPEEGYYDFLYRPYSAAFHAETVEDSTDYGYWSKVPYTLRGSDVSSLSYSVPLVLEDGTVFGVLGVELLTDYLRTHLPWEELADGGRSSYCLAVADPGQSTYSVNLVSGPAGEYLSPGDKVVLAADKTGEIQMNLGGEDYHVSMEAFNLYNSNTPFQEEEWVLLGIVPDRELYAFSNQVKFYLNLAILCTLMVGVLGSIFISRRVTKPVRRLYRDLAQARQKADAIPTLPSTGILEIDQFSRVFTSLSRDVVDASTRFLRIMEMASVELGGFEVRGEKVFVTDNFFSMFGCGDVDISTLTAESFQEKVHWIYQNIQHTTADNQNSLFQVSLPDGQVRYLHVEITQEGDRHVGLVEDVTQTTRERLRIERERDYDLLTGLYSRRAFYQRAEQLFREPDRLGQAALVMMDLDNLKRTNDRFGHDWGDQYIRQAGQCFARAVPAGTLCARISGDEFCVLIHGFREKQEVRKVLEELSQAIQASVFPLPNGEITRISVSGGVAWYPQDSGQFRELLRYADFAMYQVKQLGKGSIQEFSREEYDRQHAMIQSRRELVRLLGEQRLSYHFQPVVDGETGRILGFEALMRSGLSHLSSPAAVLELARAEGRLHEVEYMSCRRGLEAFQQLREGEQVSAQALLFLNSIAGQHLIQSELQSLSQRFGDVLARTVLEISAQEELDPGALESKRTTPGFSGMTALDNCCGGPGEERAMWLLSPRFVKVDVSLVRNLDQDEEKQAAFRRILRQAHEREIKVIAVGIETDGELREALSLGADYLQGFFLARPGAVPPPVSLRAQEEIARFWSKRRDGPPETKGEK